MKKIREKIYEILHRYIQLLMGKAKELLLWGMSERQHHQTKSKKL